MDQITNFKDLCQFFSADSPAELNRRVYKGTDCGASISVRVGRIAKGTRRTKLVFRKGPKGIAVLKAAYDLQTGLALTHVSKGLEDLFDLKAAGKATVSNAMPSYSKLYRALVGHAKSGHKLLDSFTVERTFNASAGVFLVVVREDWTRDSTKWIHNGGDWSKLTLKSPLVSFSIQTIVEGSDVTVDGDEMTLPVATKAVDDWIKEMEAQASFYWDRDNSHWLAVRRDGKPAGWAKETWGKYSFDPDVPHNVRKGIRALVSGQSVGATPVAIPGCKGWTAQEDQAAGMMTY